MFLNRQNNFTRGHLDHISQSSLFSPHFQAEETVIGERGVGKDDRGVCARDISIDRIRYVCPDSQQFRQGLHGIKSTGYAVPRQHDIRPGKNYI